MRRIFKARANKKHIFKWRYLIYIGLIYLSFDTTYSFLLDNKTKLENEAYLKYILTNTNHNFASTYQPRHLLNGAISLLANIDLTKPTTLLSMKTNTNSDSVTQTVIADNSTVSNKDESYDPDAQAKITEYVKDPNPTSASKPIVYVYNSHQLENYDTKELAAYNITPNVMMASYILKDKLNDLGVETVVNDSNLIEFMRVSNMSHADSYKASRIFIMDAKNKYSSLEYYIDIHRDSVTKSSSTKVINGKSYAKMLFVVGLENANYQKNLDLANALSNKINAKYSGLSRGVIKKEGPDVNGVYNQDISPKAMLIEIGGYENTLEEVMSSVDALAGILYDYIKGAS